MAEGRNYKPVAARDFLVRMLVPALYHVRDGSISLPFLLRKQPDSFVERQIRFLFERAELTPLETLYIEAREDLYGNVPADHEERFRNLLAEEGRSTLGIEIDEIGRNARFKLDRIKGDFAASADILHAVGVDPTNRESSTD